MRFRSRQHLRRQADFAAVRQEGRRQFAGGFVFSVRRCPPTPGRDLPRFAVIASRRVGDAVVRNRLKRQMREIFRRHQASFPAEADIVVSLQAAARGTSFAELERRFLAAARRTGLLARASGSETSGPTATNSNPVSSSSSSPAKPKAKSTPRPPSDSRSESAPSKAKSDQGRRRPDP